jgi:hypothetical protein
MAAERKGPRSPAGSGAGKDEATGRFLPGNRFWHMRSTHGRPRLYDNAADLEADCAAYFDWVEQNPRYREEVSFFQGVPTHTNVALRRVSSIGGLCLHLGIDNDTWLNWRKERPDLKDVIARADLAIATDQLEGGMAGEYNGVIVSRVLGLADKSELSGPGGRPIQTEDVTRDAEDFSSRMARLAAGASGGGDGEADPEGKG